MSFRLEPIEDVNKLEAAGYDADQEILRIQFTDRTYDYYGVTEQMYREFVTARSKWEFLLTVLEAECPKAEADEHKPEQIRFNIQGSPLKSAQKTSHSHAAEDIAFAIAERESRKLARRVIRHLQRMHPLAHSNLENVWNEICVQVQGTQSIYWDRYIDAITGVARRHAEQIEPVTKQAMWLQTETGKRWQQANNESDIPCFDDEVAEYVLHDYILSAADRWTNARIREYNE
jgi:hypothetical protein